MADDGEVVPWAEEEIPDDDQLFMRVHHGMAAGCPHEKPKPRAFEPKQGGTSMNWSRYADAQRTRDEAGEQPKTGKPGQFKNPADFGVVKLEITAVRKVRGLSVKHTPKPSTVPPNRSHTDVSGTNDERLRVELRRLCEWIIPVSQPETL